MDVPRGFGGVKRPSQSTFTQRLGCVGPATQAQSECTDPKLVQATAVGGQDSCRGASSRCHICCWHTFLLHPGQPRTRAKRPDPSRRRIRTPDPDCCEWVISAPLAASCCAAGVPRSIGCRSAEDCPQVVYQLGPAAESSTSPLALVRHLS